MLKQKSLINKFSQIENLELKLDTPLKKYTSFKVGGPAAIFLIPENISALQKVLVLRQESDLPFFVLGRGSNIIAGDLGFKGIIVYTGHLNKISIEDNLIKAQCGVTLNSLAEKALNNSLSGLEFISGIPGSLGGALYMNAGAYGREIKDIVKSVAVLNDQGQQKILSQQELDFSYRHSILKTTSLVAVEASLELKSGKSEEILSEIKTLQKKRKAQQPLSLPSAGSTFKRPPDHYAGRLIEKAGLKGTRVGDAQVSTKHAGFIVNNGKATAHDILKLINIIQERVYTVSGVKLEIEPILIGDFN